VDYGRSREDSSSCGMNEEELEGNSERQYYD